MVISTALAAQGMQSAGADAVPTVAAVNTVAATHATSGGQGHD